MPLERLLAERRTPAHARLAAYRETGSMYTPGGYARQCTGPAGALDTGVAAGDHGRSDPRMASAQSALQPASAAASSWPEKPKPFQR